METQMYYGNAHLYGLSDGDPSLPGETSNDRVIRGLDPGITSGHDLETWMDGFMGLDRITTKKPPKPLPEPVPNPNSMLIILNGMPACGKTTIASGLCELLFQAPYREDLIILDLGELTRVRPESSEFRDWASQKMRARSRIMLFPLLRRLIFQDVILTTCLTETPDDIACLREIMEEVERLQRPSIFIELRTSWVKLEERFKVDWKRHASTAVEKVKYLKQLEHFFNNMRLCRPVYALDDRPTTCSCIIKINGSKEEAVQNTARIIWQVKKDLALLP